MLNVDGQQVPQKGYITDELTDYAIEWLGKTTRDKPFFLYLSHKGVHANFVPAERHKGVAEGRAGAVAGDDGRRRRPRRARFPPGCATSATAGTAWSIPYHSTLDVAEYYRRYMETLRAVDDSVGRVVEWLKKESLLESTLVIYMGDNGFAFGEHGLIDKRTAFDWSMRVPMLVYAPGLVAPGQQIDRVVANIDIAPTMLDAGGREGAGAHAGHEHAAGAARREGAVARHAALRVLLGVELPADADAVRAARRALQVRLHARRVGRRHVLRPAGRSG